MIEAANARMSWMAFHVGAKETGTQMEGQSPDEVVAELAAAWERRVGGAHGIEIDFGWQARSQKSGTFPSPRPRPDGLGSPEAACP